MERLTIVALLVVLLMGCGAADPISTASGKPDTTIRNVKADCVRTEMLSSLMSKGWSIKSSTDTQIVAQRPMPGGVTSFMMSSRSGGAPDIRGTYTMVQIGPDVRIVLEPVIVANPGSPFEQLTPIKPTGALQQTIVDSGNRVEGVCKSKST